MSHRSAAVASRGIELALRNESFRLDDIRRGIDDPPAQSTIYRVLRQLEDDEWIEHRGNRWHPDIQATMLAGNGSTSTDTNRANFEIDTDDLLE